MNGRIRHATSLLTRSFGDEVVIAAPGGEDFVHLRGTSAAVWGLLDVPRALPEIVEAVAEFYGAVPDAISSDVEALLENLLRRGLIEEVGSGGG